MSTEVATIGTPLVNTRREKFCQELVIGASQSEAARRAGYGAKVIRSAGSSLMTYPDIQKRVAELQAAAVDASIMTVIERKARLSEIGRAKIQDYHNEHGALDPFRAGVPNPGAVAEVQQEYDSVGLEAYPTKIKLHDPAKAIDLLNKMEGAYPAAKLEISGRDGGPIELTAIRERLVSSISRLAQRAGETKDNFES